MKLPQIIRKKNVVEIRRPEATYTILYGIHVRTQNQEELPSDTDALVLETGIHAWEEDPAHCAEILRDHVQYRDLFRRAEEERIPIVFADVKYKYSDSILLTLDNAASALQWMAGMRLLKQVVGNDKKNPPRPSPLQSTLQVGLAAWMLLPFFSTFLRLISSLTGKGEDESARLKKFSHKIHPETEILYLQTRNAIIAEKVRFLADRLGGHPHIVTVLGAGHVGIEDMLVSDEQREKYVKNVSPLLNYLARPEYLYQMAIVEFDGEKWKKKEMFTIPELHKYIH